MSTHICEFEGKQGESMIVNRFYGGIENGFMLCFVINGRTIALTRQQARELTQHLIGAFDDLD